MTLSTFGAKFTRKTGILLLMDDLGSAAAGGDIRYMLGGGNPAQIPEMQRLFRRRMQTMLSNDGEFEERISVYPAPAGEADFVRALADLLAQTFGWPVTPENIALTNGSQNAFFLLFNMLAGAFPDGRRKQILLPLAPEYIGYEDVGLTEDLFVANRPEIEHLGEQIFKYRVDFDAVTVTPDIGAICVSRPTNPTGNVLTDDEIAQLRELARAHGIPFIIDNAYGNPFPGIIYAAATPVWDEDIILCMSLSKLGLPAARTGIVVARPEVVRALSGMNAIIGLAPGSLGAALALDLLRSGEIIRASRQVIMPFYQAKANRAVAQLQQALAGLDCFIHKPEGAFFLWLWFKDLPITTQELYTRLKSRGVLVVPGQYFFPGLPGTWRHTDECIRVSYAQAEADVAAGLDIIAQEVRRAYDEG